MQGKVFLDTNVLVYAHDSDSPGKRARSQELIFELLRAGSGVVSAQVLSEFFVTITQKVSKTLSCRRARREVMLLSTMATVDIDASLVAHAIDMKEEWGISYWDALILSAAERAECDIVYSEDLSDGQSYGSVRVVNPY